MNRERARIMGELEFETGNIEVELTGKVVEYIVLIAAIIKIFPTKQVLALLKL